MQKAVSVCIPARNEANNIGRTIDSVLRQHDGLELEVLVCANACTDNTESIVLDKAMDDKRLHLISSAPGKPNAWNELLSSANYDCQVFMDGDVIATQGSLAALAESMQGRRVVASSSTMRKIVKSPGLVSNFLHAPLEIPGSEMINGAMYSISREGLLKQMSERGFTKMPGDIINEDHWLTLVLERREKGDVMERRWDWCRDAVVYYQAERLSDRFKLVKRWTEGDLQLETEYPELGYVMSQESIARKIAKWYRKWKSLDNWEDRIVTPVSFIMRRLFLQSVINYAAKKAGIRSYREGLHTNLWAEARSTKEPIYSTTFDYCINGRPAYRKSL